jgi:hypothetical protein
LISESKNFSADDILEKILKLENNYPVKTWKVYGFYIWPVIRISYGLKLMRENFLSSENQLSSANSSHTSDAIDIISTSLLNSFKDSTQNQKLNKKYSFVFLNASSTRYFQINKKWYNPFSDSFIKYFEEEGLNSLVLEYPDVNKIPRYNPSKYIGTGISLMSLNALIEKKIERIDLSLLNKFDEFLSEVNLSSEFFLIKILRVYNYSVYFERILKKAKPSLVIVEGFYSYIATGMLLAAKRLGIKCIDVQHGVQSENDFLFSRWDNLPDKGYEVLPDIFWCWSDEEKVNINQWAKSTNLYSAITGGNPVLEINEEDNNAIDDVLFKTEDVKILYTHQADFELSQLFIKILKSSPDNWKWYIRFHPQYPEAAERIKEKLPSLNLKNIVIDKMSELPLPVILREMDLHVTEFSSTVLEAETLGISSIVLSEYGRSLFNKQIEKGIAKYVTSENMFVNIVEGIIEKQSKAANGNKNHEYFLSGVDYIKKLVKEKSSQ